MEMMLKCVRVGYIPTNCYIIVCNETQEGVVVDPGISIGEAGRIIRNIEKLNVRVKSIVNTHGHPDHTSGNRAIKEYTGAPILIHECDAPLLTEPWLGAEDSPAFKRPHRCPVCGREEMVKLDVSDGKARTISGCGVVVLEAEISPPADQTLKDEDRVRFGKSELTVLYTPGHTKGGISLYSRDERFLFSGDTLFAGSCGRTDLASSSNEDMARSLRRLMQLPGETVVFPGHGGSTTIEIERRGNPCLSAATFDQRM
jgi:hydroxyacylglutathione hydrolase